MRTQSVDCVKSARIIEESWRRSQFYFLKLLISLNQPSSIMSASEANDGGIILSIFLMVAAITYAMYAAISIYVTHKPKKDSDETMVQTLVRTLSAWANIGNSVIHLLLIVYIKVNEGSEEPYWVRERELEADGIGGPLGLAILNFAAGMCSLHKKHLSFPLFWNSFVIVAGTCIPLVWLRFLEEGLSNWPYVIIFVWFAIFSAELSGIATAWTYKLISTDSSAKKED